MEKIKIFYMQYSKEIKKILFIFSIFLTVFLFMKYLFSLFIPFIIGWIISFFTTPIYHIFNKKLKIKDGIATFLSIIVFISVVGLIGTYLFYIIREQLEDIYLNLDIYINEFNNFSTTIKNLLDTAFFLVPENLKNFVNDFFTNIIPIFLKSIGTYAKDFMIKTVSFVPKIVVYFFIGLISSFFITRDKELIKTTILNFMPKSIGKNTKMISHGLNIAVLGYIKAQGILMCFTGIIAIIGLSIFGYPYGLLVGIIIAIIDAIPFFGSGFILWPWAIYFIVSGEISRGIILFCLYGTILLTRQMLEPKVLGQQIGIHPLLTLMSIFIGASLMGVLGIFLGPISLVICKVIWQSDVA